MDEGQNAAVSLRAYQIWEQRGRPDGEHESHWKQALQELGLMNPAEQSLGTTVTRPKQEDDDDFDW